MSKWILLAMGGLAALLAWRACSGGSQAGQGAPQATSSAREIVLCELAPAPADGLAAADSPSAVFEAGVRAQLERLAGLLAHPAALDLRALEPLTAYLFRCRPLRPRALVLVWSNASMSLFRPAVEEQTSIDHVGREGLRNALLTLIEPLRGGGGKAIEVETEIGAVLLDKGGGECTVRYRASSHPPRGPVQQNASWRCRWTLAPGTGALPLLESIELDFFEELRAEPGPGGFVDCSAAVLGSSPAWRNELLHGLDHFAARLDRALGLSRIGQHGLAIADVNGDGLDDLFVCQPGGLPNRLFVQNADGSATEVAREAGLDHLDATSSALFADFDGDGDQDACIALGQQLAFFANNGQGGFAPASMLSGPALASLCAADYDLDRDVDVYACGFGLLRNEGKLVFADVTGEVGLHLTSSGAAAWEDYDNDGDSDLYVASADGASQLWRNEKSGEHVAFVDVAAEAGVAGSGNAVSWADFDGDGLMDFYVSSATRGSQLFQSAGKGGFRDVGLQRGASPSGRTRGARFVDLDGDGLPDLLASNGFAERGRDLCLLGTGNRFVDASRVVGLDLTGDARTAASSDWDQDGDPDLWLASCSAPRLSFLRNDLARSQGSVALRLVGKLGSRDAIGARVQLTLVTPGGPVLRTDSVRAGDGFLSQSSKWLHFALAEGARIESVDVGWPCGGRERFSGVEPGGRYELVEGTGRAAAWRGGAKRAVTLAPSPSIPAALSTNERVVFAARPPFAGFRYESAPDGLVLALVPRGMPLLVTLWRSGCTGCATQLAELAAAKKQVAEHAEVLALSVDGPDARPAAEAALDDCAWPHGIGFAAPELVGGLAVLQRALVERAPRLRLPASFLVDRDGNLAVITTGLLDAQQLARDLELLDLAAPGRLESAVPFTGRWFVAPPSMDLEALEAAFRAAGLDEIAAAQAKARQDAELRPAKRR